MKIAFTSCIDAEDDPRQEVWNRIHALQPDVLLLLGDSVYMDFGVKAGCKRDFHFNSPGLGKRLSKCAGSHGSRQQLSQPVHKGADPGTLPNPTLVSATHSLRSH